MNNKRFQIFFNMLFLFHFAETKNLYLLLSTQRIIIDIIENKRPKIHVINNGKQTLFVNLIKIKMRGIAKKINPIIKEKIIINI